MAEPYIPPVSPDQYGVAVVVLIVVLVIGLFAGRAKGRIGLLLTGVVVTVVAGVVITWARVGPPAAALANWIATLYPIVVPLVVAFVAGWLLARGSLFKRLVVLVAAVLLLAVFPYVAAAEATARFFARG